MITIQQERLTERLEELKPLFPVHWAELALDQDKVPLDPEYSIYLERDRRGEVLFVTAREDAAIVGYYVGFVAPGLHYRTCLTLIGDIWYVTPGARGAALGASLFKEVQRLAKARGVARMFTGTKLHKDAGFLLEQLGHSEVERYYSLWLGD